MPQPATVTAKMIMNMIEQQGFRCAISGRELTPETASLDHIMPLGRGGAHDIKNVWIVDHVVNIAKGTLTVPEFVTLCRDVVKYQDAKSTATSA